MNNTKAMLPVLISALLAWVTPPPGDPKGFEVWTGQVSRIAEQQISWDQIGLYNNHQIGISYLRDDGPAELDESQVNIYIVQEGEATLVVGGIILKPETIKPHEVRGISIKGGSETHLREGTIVHISANVPHQLKVARGKEFIYTTIRVDSR
jgi:hypothetical protein